jgi:hypothetical protein
MYGIAREGGSVKLSADGVLASSGRLNFPNTFAPTRAISVGFRCSVPPSTLIRGSVSTFRIADISGGT